MIKAFKVAEHIFHLQLKDDSSLWPQLKQYDPFEVELSEKPLFTLTLNQSLENKEMELVYDPQTEEGETLIRLYRSEGEWSFEMSPTRDYPVCGIARTDSDFRNAELRIDSRKMNDAVFCINNTLMLMYAFSTAGLNTLELHASVIRNNGKGYLFLAKSGTGKSTHSNQWLENIPGSDLLNDDNPIVRVWPDGRVIVYGSPWSGKTPCYRNIECPVGAFVRIRRCPENKITRLSLLESYALIYSSSSGFKADSAMADGLHASIAGAVETVPSFVLDCRPDAEAATVCYKGVTDESIGQ